jgi:hypothetical protein
MIHAGPHPCGRYDGVRQTTDGTRVGNYRVNISFALTSHHRLTATSASKLPSSIPLTISRFSPLGMLSVALLSTRRRRVVALLHDVRCELRRELDEKVLPDVGDGGAELRGRSPKVLRSRVRMDGSSRFGFDNGRTNVGRTGIEFGVGVGERRDGSDVDATLHRDDSPAANPEGYTLSFSAEAARGEDSRGGVEDTLIVGGARSAGVGVVGEGGGDGFGAETYIACRTEGVNDESAVDSVVEIEG